jgi:hemoglobin
LGGDFHRNHRPTIYEWAGGRAAFERWFDAFYDLVERDDLLAPLFGGRVSAEHRDHVATWWSEVMGGPAEYTEREGGYEHMVAKHRDLAISGEQRLRFVTLLSRAADDAGLPDDPEFRAALMGYAEWGTRLAVRTPGREPRWRRTRPCQGGGGASPRRS